VRSMGKTKKKRKDSDYKNQKSKCFTKKDHVKPAKGDKILKLDNYHDRDQKKNRSHPNDKQDEHTGFRYMKKRQGKFNDIGGSRGIGLFVTEFIPAGKLAYLSLEPGILMTLLDKTEYIKNGYHFIGRTMFAKSCHTMKANVVSMLDETTVEIANAKLIKISKEYLLKKYYFVVDKPGMYSGIVACTDIKANSFVLLEGYDNTADYPYGNEDYLGLEKKVIGIYQSNYKKKLAAKCARLHVCKSCCELYSNNKTGRKNEHVCEGDLLTKMWDNR